MGLPLRFGHACALVLAVALLSGCAQAQGNGLSPEAAADHVGEKATVCGTVASAHYAPDISGEPTFINLGKPYPDQVFTVLVWGDFRDRFASPPETWSGHLCVTGRITSYRGKPEIKVTDQSQVTH